MTFEEQLAAADGHRFQKELGDFIIAYNCEMVVETGLGVSTLFILDAMDRMNKGHLYSIDAKPWYPHEIVHPRLTFIKDKSVNVLAELYKKTGAWDLFLHDSDHDVFCQTYEYEFAYRCLKKGGWLWSDDTSWGGHDAWGGVAKGYGFTPDTRGSAQVIKKLNDDAMAEFVVDEMNAFCISKAKSEERHYLANGGKNSEVFKDYQ